MKTTLRIHSRRVRCIALVLALLPAICHGGSMNVWITQPANDQDGLVAWRLPICSWPDEFGAIQDIGQLGNAWAWNNATIDEGNTGEDASFASTAPAFEGPGTWTVQAIYEIASHGVECTVVCPNEATAPDYPVCSQSGTNYMWGGVFTYTYTWVDQSGATNAAGGLWFVEHKPTVDTNTTCPYGGPLVYTQVPDQLDGDGMASETITVAPFPPPPTNCVYIVHIPGFLGATSSGPWSCPYNDTGIVRVSHPPGYNALITAVDNGVTDPSCGY